MGVTIGGIHSRDMKMNVNLDQLPVLPPVRNNLEVIPGRAGSMDFGMEYEERKITLSCSISLQKTFADLADVAADITAWLNPYQGTQQMILDEMPDRYWDVRLNSGIDMDRIIMNAGTFDLEFVAPDPFAKAVVDDIYIMGEGEITPGNLATTFSDFVLDGNKMKLSKDVLSRQVIAGMGVRNLGLADLKVTLDTDKGIKVRPNTKKEVYNVIAVEGKKVTIEMESPEPMDYIGNDLRIEPYNLPEKKSGTRYEFTPRQGNMISSPRVEIRGVLSSAQSITLVFNNNESVKIKGPLSSTEVFIVDTDKMTAMVQNRASGKTLRNGLPQMISLVFPEIITGKNSIDIIQAGGTFTQLKLISRSRWL